MLMVLFVWKISEEAGTSKTRSLAFEYFNPLVKLRTDWNEEISQSVDEVK